MLEVFSSIWLIHIGIFLENRIDRYFEISLERKSKYSLLPIAYYYTISIQGFFTKFSLNQQLSYPSRSHSYITFRFNTFVSGEILSNVHSKSFPFHLHTSACEFIYIYSIWFSNILEWERDEGCVCTQQNEQQSERFCWKGTTFRPQNLTSLEYEWNRKRSVCMDVYLYNYCSYTVYTVYS